MEHRIARLAGESRSPVVDGIHMLIRSILTAKCPCAGLASDDGGPVVLFVHVLIACAMTSKQSIAGLAFDPMAKIVHVLVAISLVVEGWALGVHLDCLMLYRWLGEFGEMEEKGNLG